jgi:hypothetical protein
MKAIVLVIVALSIIGCDPEGGLMQHFFSQPTSVGNVQYNPITCPPDAITGADCH